MIGVVLPWLIPILAFALGVCIGRITHPATADFGDEHHVSDQWLRDARYDRTNSRWWA